MLIVSGVLLLFPAAARAEEDANYRDQMKAAIRLHDAGDYDSALEIYQRLLKAYPDDGRVLHEMALTTSAKGDYKESISLAERALKKGTSDPASSWSLIGSDYDLLEKYDKGEKAFREGLRKYPDSAILHFNLGINLAKQGKNGPAAEELEEDLRLRPRHPGGWISLAKVAAAQGDRGKEFLATARFLTLEPEGPRSKDASARLWALLMAGVSKKPGKNAEGKSNIEVTLTLPPKGKDKDADSGGAMIMALVAAARYTDDWENRSDAEFFAHALESVTAILSGADDKPERLDPFWGPQAHDYFKAAKEHGHLEAMAYDMRRSLADPPTLQWLEEHPDAVAAYRAWSETWKPSPPESRQEKP